MRYILSAVICFMFYLHKCASHQQHITFFYVHLQQLNTIASGRDLQQFLLFYENLSEFHDKYILKKTFQLKVVIRKMVWTSFIFPVYWH